MNSFLYEGLWGLLAYGHMYVHVCEAVWVFLSHWNWTLSSQSYHSALFAQTLQSSTFQMWV